MKALRVLIVDDETHARDRLRRLLEKDESVEIVGECASGTEAVAAVGSLQPDLMMLDIQMPELDGFGVLEAIPGTELPLVIFVTAYDEHAIHAFDVHAVDYVLKPVEAPRLYAAIARARLRAKQEMVRRPSGPEDGNTADAAASALVSAPADEVHQFSDRLLVRQDGQIYPIRAREIIYVEAQGNYIRLQLTDRSFMVRETMARLERRLNPEQFARIHRSVIVNLDAVRELQPYFGGDYVVILKTGGRLKASRFYKSRLAKWVLG
jgi:two-component system, LytTR family, response regulator